MTTKQILEQQKRGSACKKTKPGFITLRHILAQIIQHTRYACPDVMFPVDVVENLPDLLLRQALGVECACKALALLLLVSGYGQYSGMEVAVPVTRNPECQCTPMAVSTTGTVSVVLVSCMTFFLQVLPLF